MLIVSGLAMNALVEANAGFSKDKRNIESSQNMSVILEMIGNDIKQAGENISNNSFPTIEFNTVDPEDITRPEDSNLKKGSSKIIVRRAVISPLTLCEQITAGQNLTTLTTIKVADNLASTVNSSANCNVATSSTPLSVYRGPVPVTPATTPITYYPTTYYPTTPVTALPTTTPAPLTIKLPIALRNLRDYRCELDNPSPATAYDLPANAGTDFCDGTASEKTRIAVSNESGQFIIFNQTGEAAGATNTADTVAKVDPDPSSTKTYNISVNNNFARPDPITDPTIDPAIKSNIENNKVLYPIKSPIYVIEERVYTLSKQGNFQLSINGAAPKTLTKKIDNFIVSARTYTNSTDRIVNPKPAGASVNPVATSTTALTTANPICYSPTTPPEAVTNPQATDATETNPQYICRFNSNTAYTDPAMNWKTLAGIKVELKAKYDSAGGSATEATTDKEKLSAKAEFFPRNVLSK